MSKHVLETAAFLDSEHARSLPIDRDDVQEIAQRFLQSVFEDAGVTPRLLEREELTAILSEYLPARFGRRDPLAPHVAAVLGAYLESLVEREVVPRAFELRSGLAEGLAAFAAAVESGEHAHQRTPSQAPVVHRAAKVGRNDPCPCGSGKKFKKCCARLSG